MKRKRLSHTDREGKARMINVGDKADTSRTAVAGARVRMSAELLSALKKNRLTKGDALSAARIAGIMASKRTSEIIPLCHTIPLVEIKIDFEFIDNPPSVEIRAEAVAVYKTGVEMEALTAASVAALTIYDMGKAVDRGMVIESIRLLKKRGGVGGDWSEEGSV